MTDLYYDLGKNDLEISGGDIRLIPLTSAQNAGLFVMKKFPSLDNPQYGGALEVVYANDRVPAVTGRVNKAKKEIYQDGAQLVDVRIIPTGYAPGEYEINVRAVYAVENQNDNVNLRY